MELYKKHCLNLIYVDGHNEEKFSLSHFDPVGYYCSLTKNLCIGAEKSVERRWWFYDKLNTSKIEKCLNRKKIEELTEN